MNQTIEILLAPPQPPQHIVLFDCDRCDRRETVVSDRADVIVRGWLADDRTLCPDCHPGD
jgi:hypothetical protein